MMCNDLGLMPIVVGGTEDQKKEWLVPCAADFQLVSFCLSEPNAGSDVAGLQLLAERDGDGYVLNGTKCWITNGGHADLYTVFATMDRSTRHAGVCAFVVPRDHAEVSSEDLKAWCRVNLANYKVPKVIHVVRELPMLPIGKPDRLLLRSWAQQSVATRQETT